MAAPSPSQDLLWGLRVLIVEDHQDAAESMALFLTLLGCDTCVARTADEALGLYRNYRPAAVLLDLGLPRMNGWELARRLRRGDWAQATLIAIIGFGTAADRERSRQAGIDIHLLKPADPTLVQSLLEEVATKQRRADHRPRASASKEPTDRIDRGGSLALLAAYVQGYVGDQVRDLKVLVTREGICLRGEAQNIYAKQMAQEALFKMAPQPIVANEIEVVLVA
jgi:DNA-binding response OmpR family regulator